MSTVIEIFFLIFIKGKKYIMTAVNKAFYLGKKRQSLLVDVGIRIATCELL